MTRYRVTIQHDACTTHDVNAETKDAAVTAAFSECGVSLCHHCSDQIELADPIRAVVVENLETGESDDEVDPPYEVVSLRARVDALTAALGSDAMRDVAAERRRQFEVEGWTPENDDEHTQGEMAQAAACYALNVQRIPIRCGDSTLWPKGWDESWFKPKDRRRDLVRAAALLLAEIERLDRIPFEASTS